MEHKQKRRAIVRLFLAALGLLLAATLLSLQVTAWFSLRRTLAAYAPIDNPESIYIGAGHRNINASGFTDNHFEDIRYLYFEGIDVDKGKDYYDYVFCVFGTGVEFFKLQLSFTTNNQFTYDVFLADEWDGTEPGYDGSAEQVDYKMSIKYEGDADYRIYHYTINGSALAGSYLNDKSVTPLLAHSTEAANNNPANLHDDTYGSYERVQKYAEPIYWQTTNSISGNAAGDFIRYFILRVNLNGKATNDRETDVICIAAKSSSV
ncbi:MAG: hypothetical protein IJU52_04270 [Clostridia bacterium]|nr:hypothetical protein [Clostridia bacterium]